MQSPIVIGIIGQIGAGKDESGKILQQLLPRHTILTASFSVILRRILKAQRQSLTRQNFQRLGQKIARRKQRWLGAKMRQEILRGHSEICVLTGLRTPEDVRLAKSFPHHLLVAIHASPQTRFQRAWARKRLGDGATRRAFLAQDCHLIEKRIRMLMKQAEVHIVNEGSIEEFREAIATKVLPKIQKFL
jgi:dephospho-CoA kinase